MRWVVLALLLGIGAWFVRSRRNEAAGAAGGWTPPEPLIRDAADPGGNGVATATTGTLTGIPAGAPAAGVADEQADVATPPLGLPLPGASAEPVDRPSLSGQALFSPPDVTRVEPAAGTPAESGVAAGDAPRATTTGSTDIGSTDIGSTDIGSTDIGGIGGEAGPIVADRAPAEPTVGEALSAETTTAGSIVAEPTVTEPTVTESAAAESIAAESTVTESAAAESAVAEPAAVESTATESTVTEPAAVEPTVTESTVTEPAAVEPTATEPTVTEPAAVESAVAEPAAVESTVTESTATEPTATGPTAPGPATGVRPSPSPRRRPAFAAAGSTPTPGSAPALPDGSAPGPEYTIKGNADSMLFHRPDSPYYSRTKAEVWFRTATDARAAGFTEWAAASRRSDG